jgi:C_GCAxxG_C_C family probable redox protein
MNKSEYALGLMLQGFSCSQSVLLTYADSFGLERELALRVSSAFGGGISRMGNICGAVTGAFMVTGLKYGSVRPDDIAAKDKNYEMGREFAHRFQSRHGSILCRELLGIDISNPEGHLLAKKKGLFTSLCPLFVKGSVEILEELL